jgi:hypothetical protein
MSRLVLFSESVHQMSAITRWGRWGQSESRDVLLFCSVNLFTKCLLLHFTFLNLNFCDERLVPVQISISSVHRCEKAENAFIDSVQHFV